jgi:signal peptidase I
MNFKLPTQTNTMHEWEGGTLPPLKLTVEKGVLPAAPSALPKSGKTATRTNANLGKQLLMLMLVGILCVAAYFVISRFVLTPVIIQGRSMQPTLKDGECYFLNRYVYLFKSPERGDLVVIKDPGHDDFAVKRIIGKPGDWLNLRNGSVFLNGRRLDESYLPKTERTFAPDLHEKWIQLGNEQYFVMGDNRSNSEDSRYYGRITDKMILGQIRN